MIKEPTFYLVWVHNADIYLTIWKAAEYDRTRKPNEQLDTAVFHDYLPPPFVTIMIQALAGGLGMAMEQAVHMKAGGEDDKEERLHFEQLLGDVDVDLPESPKEGEAK